MNRPSNLNGNRHGLVLTGGGARAAYQAGVLKGISDCLGEYADEQPFGIIAGVSAGAINGAFLATHASSLREGAAALFSLWYDLQTEDVIRTDMMTMTALGTRWIRDLSFGGVLGSSHSTFLLNTSPLRALLSRGLDFAKIGEHVASGKLHGLAISATNYATGTAMSFFEGAPEIAEWSRSARVGRRERITLDHVLASAAIPILFQPVPLHGAYYGDGGIRLSAPLSPAIHLGADRILAVGIRYSRPDDETAELNRATKMGDISVADIAGVMLNAAFLDALESDVERMERINHTLTLLPEDVRRNYSLRPIPILTIRPSMDLGTLASEQFHKFPKMLRYLLRGIGASEEKGWDLLSYLAFDRAYSRRLLDLGYEDARAQKAEIEAFFYT